MAEAQTKKCCGYAVTDLQNWTYASMMKIRIHMFGAASWLSGKRSSAGYMGGPGSISLSGKFTFGRYGSKVRQL